VCGDNLVGAGEQCDGSVDTACPGRCQPDCTCGAGGTVEADAHVVSSDPARNFGTQPILQVDANTAREAFFRIRVTGIGTHSVLSAKLRLQTGSASTAPSPSGGRIHQISNCTWDERTVTWNTRPTIDGPVLVTVGAVTANQFVDLDLTSVITGDGVYCFGMDSLSSDGVDYRSREATSGRPVVLLTTGTPPAPVCGDNAINQPSEQCDGTAAGTCTAGCRADCTCVPPPVCGDGAINQPSEQCDGAASAACPGACRADCTCPPPPPPVCGDNHVNQPSEQCDGTADTACPGLCRADCTCNVPPPPPTTVVEADASVRSAAPTTSFGTAALLEVDADTPAEAYLRVRVSGVGGRTVTAAKLRLQVGTASNSQSVQGGRIHLANSCAWDESMTWNTKPGFNANILATLGAVAQAQQVEFDVTSTIPGDGVYCFAIDSTSSDGVDYNSRESSAQRPSLLITVAP
jgi:hypothetical protein